MLALYGLRYVDTEQIPHINDVAMTGSCTNPCKSIMQHGIITIKIVDDEAVSIMAQLY